MADALPAYRALLAREDIRVAVSDLDGVLRIFDTLPWEELDERLGLPEDSMFTAVLRDPLLEDVCRGRASHDAWRESIHATLRAQGVPADRALDAITAWADDRGRLDAEVFDVLLEAQGSGVELFVLTNGTDRVRDELGQLVERPASVQRPGGSSPSDVTAHGPLLREKAASRAPRRFDELFDPHGDRILNTAELGEAKPDLAAFAAAHERIEDVLGADVPRGSVAFLDDGANHIVAARAFGWHAVQMHRP